MLQGLPFGKAVMRKEKEVLPLYGRITKSPLKPPKPKTLNKRNRLIGLAFYANPITLCRIITFVIFFIRFCKFYVKEKKFFCPENYFFLGKIKSFFRAR